MTKRFILIDNCGHHEQVTKELSLDDIEKLYKAAAKKYSNFKGLELHFDFLMDNDHDGMIVIQAIEDDC
jgi:hypothetical protein